MKRVHLETVPPRGGLRYVLRFVERAFVQPGTQEIRIHGRGVEVVREMDNEDDPVVPLGSNDVDVAWLISHMDLSMCPYIPEEPALAALHRAGQLLVEKKLVPRWLVCPGWTPTATWLGLPVGDRPAVMLFGYRVTYVDPGVTNGRVVLLGAPDHHLYLSDAAVGVSIDRGV